MYEVASVRSTVRGGNHSLATWSLVMIDSVCLLFVVGLFCVCVHCHCELSISVTACTVCTCYMCVSRWSCLVADALRSPEERAGTQVVESMDGEVPPQQPEQAEPSRGGVHPHLEEERCVG